MQSRALNFQVDFRKFLGAVQMTNLKNKSLDSISQYGVLEMRRVFPLSCSNDTLLDVFVEVCGNNGFVVTERTDAKASALKEFHNMYVHSFLVFMRKLGLSVSFQA